MAIDDIPAPRSFPITVSANLSLAVLGVLITHETAYSLSTWLAPTGSGGTGSPVDHRHQGLLVAAIGPAALWLTTWFVLRQVRRLGVGVTWGAGPLAASVAALYLVQESIEMLAAGGDGPGIGGLVDNPAIVIGVVLAPLVARFLLRLLRHVEHLLTAWIAGRDRTPADETDPVPPVWAVAALAGVAHTPGAPRGPPLRDDTTIRIRIP